MLIKIELNTESTADLNVLQAILAAANGDVTHETTPEADAKPSAKSTGTTRRSRRTDKDTKPEAEEKPEPASEENSESSEVNEPTPEPEPEKAITMDDLTALGKKVTAKGKKDGIKKIWADFNVKKISDLDEADYPKVYEALEALLNG